MLSWKNTKCREQQTQSITITTPAAGEESVNRFGLLPACSPTWENTVPQRPMLSSPPAPPYIHPHQKALRSASPPGSCFGQKLSKEERGCLHRGTGLLAISWRLRKVLDALKGSASSKVLRTPHILLTSPPLQRFALCVPLPLQLPAPALACYTSPLFFPQVPNTIPASSPPASPAKPLGPQSAPPYPLHTSLPSVPVGLPPTAGRESCAAQGTSTARDQ